MPHRVAPLTPTQQERISHSLKYGAAAAYIPARAAKAAEDIVTELNDGWPVDERRFAQVIAHHTEERNMAFEDVIVVNGKRYVPEQPAPSPAPKPTRGEQVAHEMVAGALGSIRLTHGGKMYLFDVSAPGSSTTQIKKDIQWFIAAAIDAERAATRDEIAAYLDSIHYADAGNFVRTMKLD